MVKPTIEENLEQTTLQVELPTIGAVLDIMNDMGLPTSRPDWSNPTPDQDPALVAAVIDSTLQPQGIEFAKLTEPTQAGLVAASQRCIRDLGKLSTQEQQELRLEKKEDQGQVTIRLQQKLAEEKLANDQLNIQRQADELAMQKTQTNQLNEEIVREENMGHRAETRAEALHLRVERNAEQQLLNNQELAAEKQTGGITEGVEQEQGLQPEKSSTMAVDYRTDMTNEAPNEKTEIARVQEIMQERRVQERENDPSVTRDHGRESSEGASRSSAPSPHNQ